MILIKATTISTIIFIMYLATKSLGSQTYINESIHFGIYDPKAQFQNSKAIQIEHNFFSWTDDKEIISKFINNTKQNNRQIFITLEPWHKSSELQDSLLPNIAEGEYDELLIPICEELSNIKQNTYLRIGHEMELPNSRYPWSNQPPQQFIKAYQHIYQICKQISPSTTIIWSPAGETGLENYWPGPNYVDAIGVSVFSFNQWEIDNIGHQRSFDQLFNPKYNRLVSYDKPIVIAEFGITGNEDFQNNWIKLATTNFANYKLLTHIIYFNSVDVVGVWGDYPTPDWRISENSIKILTNTPN